MEHCRRISKASPQTRFLVGSTNRFYWAWIAVAAVFVPFTMTLIYSVHDWTVLFSLMGLMSLSAMVLPLLHTP